jgi:hypothetical protein
MGALRIVIETDGDTFAADPSPECCRILRVIADKVMRGDDHGTVQDLNGNVCARFDFVVDVPSMTIEDHVRGLSRAIADGLLKK